MTNHVFKSMTTVKTKKFGKLMWIEGGVALVAISIAVFASYLLYQQTIELLTQNLRERLLSISLTEAANLYAEDINALQEEKDWEKPEWTKVVTSLKRAKDSNPNIVFMYIFRKTKDDPAKMEFVADAGSLNPYANVDEDPNNNVDANGDGVIEPDGADTLQWPGQPYDEAVDIPETQEAYNGPLTAHELYSDSYGQVLTGYAPIKDSSGNVVAILATDIKADDFFNVTRQTLYPFLTFIVVLIVIISILAIVLIYLWKRQAETLAQVDKLKDEFLSIASHQLRAPITAIRGYAANLTEGDYGVIPANIKEPLETIQESARLMANSIEDYLNISRIEQGRMKYEKSDFDFADLANKVVRELTPVAEKKKLKLIGNAPDDLVIHADIGKIKQVITNLVDNAIKYTMAGSVTVTVEKKGSTARLTITDTGVGIPAEEIGLLFEKFKRARGANKVNTTGTGLGLYVAKQLTVGNGGEIWVESNGTGKGSRFIVELPAK